MNPQEIVRRIEASPALPGGEGDRFAGYAVIGLPFRSGHVLALRRFPASSIGPGYTSVWRRDPAGAWTFYSSVDPEYGWSRYFGGGIAGNVVAPIQIEWHGPMRFTVTVGAALRWDVALTQSAASRMMNRAAALMPESWWSRKPVLTAMGLAARIALRTGRMNLAGKTPNGHEFIANPQRVWLVESSRCLLDGMDIGPMGPLARQARLNDLLIPQRGVFAVVRAFLYAPDGARAVLAAPPETGPLAGRGAATGPR